MIKTTIIALAMVAALSWLGPTLDDHSAEAATAASMEDALHAADARQRFQRAAQQICGPQSPFTELADGSIQCHDRRGRKTITAEVQP
jgi:hypothetical protein